jgi:hypothetical protein
MSRQNRICHEFPSRLCRGKSRESETRPLHIANFNCELYDRIRHKCEFTQLPYRKCRDWPRSPTNSFVTSLYSPYGYCIFCVIRHQYTLKRFRKDGR